MVHCKYKINKWNPSHSIPHYLFDIMYISLSTPCGAGRDDHPNYTGFTKVGVASVVFSRCCGQLPSLSRQHGQESGMIGAVVQQTLHWVTLQEYV